MIKKNNLHFKEKNNINNFTFEEACKYLDELESNDTVNYKPIQDSNIMYELDSYYKSLANYNNMFSLQENILFNEYQIFLGFIGKYCHSFSNTFGSFNSSSFLHFNKFLGTNYFLIYISMLYRSINRLEFSFKDFDFKFHPSWKNHFFDIYYYHGGSITELKKSFVKKTKDVLKLSDEICKNNFIIQVSDKVNDVLIKKIVDHFKCN